MTGTASYSLQRTFFFTKYAVCEGKLELIKGLYHIPGGTSGCQIFGVLYLVHWRTDLIIERHLDKWDYEYDLSSSSTSQNNHIQYLKSLPLLSSLLSGS